MLVHSEMANNHASKGKEVNLEGIKYVTELDETNTRVIERFRIGKELGHVWFYQICLIGIGRICYCISTN